MHIYVRQSLSIPRKSDDKHWREFLVSFSMHKSFDESLLIGSDFDHYEKKHYTNTHVRLIQPPGRATQRLRKTGGAGVTAGAARLVLATTCTLGVAGTSKLGNLRAIARQRARKSLRSIVCFM
mgnify:CR=1 FL=1